MSKVMKIKGRKSKNSEIVCSLENDAFPREILKSALLLRGEEQEKMFALARRRRDEHFPSMKVEVRSVIEISNICSQGCRYCNMGKYHSNQHYIMDHNLLLNLVEHLYGKGRRVILLQSGENHNDSYIEHVTGCIREIMHKFKDLTLIMCIGNLDHDHYTQIKKAGAQRYILKFETSNPEHYKKIKPLDKLENRLSCLEDLISIGFQVGTGNITGLPYQTLDDIVNDLFLVKKFSLAMCSSSVFIPAETSEFKDEPVGDIDLTLNTMALMRIMNPHLLMPTTSSLEKCRKDGQFMGLMAGANTVTIHDGTPPELKSLFPIYSLDRVTPNKAHMENIVKRAKMKME